MKNTTKILSVFLTLLLLVSIVSIFPASAYTELEQNGIHYSLDKNGNATITDIKSEGDTLVIPATIDEHPVTAIGKEAFSHVNYRKIVLPDSVTDIAEKAFFRCEAVEEVVLPKDLKVINEMTFWQCYKLKSINLPEGITYLGSCAFSYCAFEEITIPASVTYLGQSIFSANHELENITFLPENLTYIGKWIFNSTPFFKNTENWDNGMLILNDHLFYVGSDAPAEVVIPNSVKLIAEDAFNGAQITQVTLPDSITEIPNYCFEHCIGLKTVNIPASVTYIGSYAFQECNSLTEINIPETVKSTGSCVFMNCKGLKSVAWPEHLTSIQSGSFMGCENLEYVFIPETVKVINIYAFMNCKNLKTITIPENVEFVDYGLGYCETHTQDEIGMPCIEVTAIYGFTIKGFKGTAAESYAAEHNFIFKELTHSQLLGDVDLSGELTVKDATLLQKHIAEIEIPYDAQQALSDMDKNGDITVKDATKIQKFIAKIE